MQDRTIDYDALLVAALADARDHVWREERNLPNRASEFLDRAGKLLDEAPLKMPAADWLLLQAELDELIARYERAGGI